LQEVKEALDYCHGLAHPLRGLLQELLHLLVPLKEALAVLWIPSERLGRHPIQPVTVAPLSR